MFFKYPSPEAYASPSPSRGEGSGLLRSARNDTERTNIALKDLDVVRQYAALLERRVQQGTRARKTLVVTRQANPLGRSMIEMLGVLAIIAVLTVGGIAGYSKAMQKFKQNKWLAQIEELMFSTKELYKNEKIYGKPNQYLTATLKNLGAIPTGMLDENNLDIYGNTVNILILQFLKWNRFAIIFYMKPNTEAEYNCRELFNFSYTNPDIFDVVNWANSYAVCGKSVEAQYKKESRCVSYNWQEIINKCKICKTNTCDIVVLFNNET